MEPVIWTALTSFFVAGASYGAVIMGLKKGLNGTAARVKDVGDRLVKHIDDESGNDKLTHERLAKVETKVDLIYERIK